MASAPPEDKFVTLCGGTIDLAKRRRDLANFDALGPLSRDVIRESPIDIEVRMLVARFREGLPLMDPDDPKTLRTPAQEDEMLAAYLTRAIQAKMPGYRPLPARGTGK